MTEPVQEEPEIVDSEPDFTPDQDAVIRQVYTHLANLIPEPGRDYVIRFDFPDKADPTKVEIHMKGLTEVGQAWAEACMKYFEGDQP